MVLHVTSATPPLTAPQKDSHTEPSEPRRRILLGASLILLVWGLLRALPIW